MQHADVAVIVPVYNRAGAVVKTLSTVARQSLAPQRIIVVDDGSTDGTAAAVKQWADVAAPAFETLVISQPNQGAGAARNRGLENAGTCPYVAFLDSDDHWPEDFLARATARLDADNRAVAATADRRFLRTWKRRAGFVSSRNIERNATKWILNNNAGIASCTLFRMETVRRIGGFDASIPTGQDVEMFLRMSIEGRWLHVAGEPVRFYVGFTGAAGEEANLSHKYTDRMRRWARIRERFIFKQGGARHLDEHSYKRPLARLWHKIARFYAYHGKTAWAIACYRKSLSYRPTRISTRLRLMQLSARPTPKTELKAAA